MKNFSENVKTFFVMWLAYFLGARSYAVMAYHKTDFKKEPCFYESVVLHKDIDPKSTKAYLEAREQIGFLPFFDKYYKFIELKSIPFHKYVIGTIQGW